MKENYGELITVPFRNDVPDESSRREYLLVEGTFPDVHDPRATDAFEEVDTSIHNTQELAGLFAAAKLSPVEYAAVMYSFIPDSARGSTVVPFCRSADRPGILQIALKKLRDQAQAD